MQAFRAYVIMSWLLHSYYTVNRNSYFTYFHIHWPCHCWPCNHHWPCFKFKKSHSWDWGTSQTTSCTHRCLISRKPIYFVRAYIAYVGPLLEYATQTWSPYRVSLINLLETVQRGFTKRIPVFLFNCHMPIGCRPVDIWGWQGWDVCAEAVVRWFGESVWKMKRNCYAWMGSVQRCVEVLHAWVKGLNSNPS